jgi:hypothetical protein
MYLVGFPKVSSVVSKAASGMSARTLLRTTLLDAVMYGLHWMNVSSMFIPPGLHISLTRVSVARYTHILPPLNLDAYLILLLRIVSVSFRRYCSIVLQKLLQVFCVGNNLTGFRLLWAGFGYHID